MCFLLQPSQITTDLWLQRSQCMSYSFVGRLSNMGVARAQVKVLAGLRSPEFGGRELCSRAQAVGRV